MKFNELVSLQKRTIRSGVTSDLKFRKKQLLQLKQLIKKNELRIMEALKKDLGKTEQESFVSEIGIIYEEINHVVSHLSKWMKTKSYRSPLILQPSKGRVLSEPYGSVLIIAPWNYPFNLVISPMIGALAAGNAVVLKPSEISCFTQSLLVELINEEFDEALVYCVGGGIPESEELLKEPFDFIFFTGSPNVGKIVMRSAAENLTPVCLELGGKSPCIIDKDVQLDVAAKRIVWGKFYNAGQTCVAPDYIYVPKFLKREFIELVKKYIVQFYGTNPKKSPHYGRIINSKNLERLAQFVNKEKVVVGGEVDGSTLYIAPTVLDDVSWDDPVMLEEIFGPLMPILEYVDLEEVVENIGDRPKPLALYLFTESKKTYRWMEQRLSYGGGCINDCMVHLAHPELPFGGVGFSGMGAYHGRYSFDLFSHKKGVLERSCHLDIPLRYPPYSSKNLKRFKKILR